MILFQSTVCRMARASAETWGGWLLVIILSYSL